MQLDLDRIARRHTNWFNLILVPAIGDWNWIAISFKLNLVLDIGDNCFIGFGRWKLAFFSLTAAHCCLSLSLSLSLLISSLLSFYLPSVSFLSVLPEADLFLTRWMNSWCRGLRPAMRRTVSSWAWPRKITCYYHPLRHCLNRHLLTRRFSLLFHWMQFSLTLFIIVYFVVVLGTLIPGRRG